MSRYARWSSRLAGFSQEGRRRTLTRVQSIGPVDVIVDGRPMLLACGNDYLGLAHTLDAQGAGSCSSRSISGTHPEHLALEAALEEWLGRPTLIFPSGYHANLAVFSTVCESGQTVASDALNHASIIDGLRLSKANRVVVPHAQPNAIPADVDLVVTESLFSMDGDRAPLADYPPDPWLAVDEAHAIGALGPGGRGLCAKEGLVPDILIGTFGKAFGTAGAFVSGPAELKDLLVNAGRSFIYTTAAPIGVVRAAHQALERILVATAERDRLAFNARTLRNHLQQLGWTVLGDAHILPVFTGEDTMETAERLQKAGIFAPGIRFPTVPRGRERIRLTVSAAHTETQLEQIAEGFGAR